ncbi:hypothetical protein CFIO01_02143 [Colletotrichum fioriniae PJ7]|uniref:Uncharacterized protein n=1 Tax=Colletotrichum fioriniae PJ7 TaxID=1445577 RepID=A0A010R897_9PEZI|nr:hypothetical protein CFIO01_02143 [Colletotrichum fioriniae PJ7]
MDRKPIVSPCTDEVSEISSVDSLSIRTSTTYVQQRSSREHVELGAPMLIDTHEATKHQRTLDHDIPNWKVLPATSLINEAGSLLSQANTTQEPSRWQAIGTFGLCVLGIGTIFIIGAVGFMSFFWQNSMQAKEVVVKSTLWSQIVFADWASRSITLTAAVLRVCLALQMSVFTAMIASFMIERTGVSFSAAPFVSMLRAMSASPYNLISWTPFDMPWGIGTVYIVAITTSVLLTAASQLASTTLLSDFAVINVTAPLRAVNILYGNSSVINPTVMQGSSIWKSKPWVYPRFAELQRQPTEAEQSEFYEDTGTILRAFIPFANGPSRSRLRTYEGPAAVVDSRVVCVRPNIRNVTFSAVAFDFSNDTRLETYSEFNVLGQFDIQGGYDQLPINRGQNQIDEPKWLFNCVVPAEDIHGYSKGEPLASQIDNFSICSVGRGENRTWPDGKNYTMPFLPSPFSALNTTYTSIFLVFNGTGTMPQWHQGLRVHGNLNSSTSRWEASADKWISTSDGMWNSVDIPWEGHAKRVGVSVTACFANLQSHVQNVSMSSKVDGQEPILAWDSPNAQYTTNVIRDQYSSICKGPSGAKSDSELLELLPKKSWKSENHRLSLDVITSQLPFMTRSLHDPLIDPSPCGMLRTGGYSSRAVHYAHSALFQDVLRTSMSVPEALQAILTVTQQMSYYDTLPYFRNAWPATYAMTEEKLIPVRARIIPHPSGRLQQTSNSLQREVSDEDRASAEKNTPQSGSLPPDGQLHYGGTTAERMFRFQDFKFLKIYISCILLYLLAAVAAVVWSYQGPAVDRDYYMQRVFRTPDSLKVDQLYSGIALSALLAPAGMLVQWIMHDFRHLRLFALTAQRPVLLADLDKIGDDSSAWTLRILGKYSWWYAVMQAALIVIRTSIVPVGTLMLTTGAFYENITGVDVVGMPILPSNDSSVTRLANAMGWEGHGAFKQTLDDNDNFLSRTVYTFVGNIVSQSALVDVFSGVIGPIPTHNLTFNINTTYHGLILYHWDANCEAATQIPFTTSLNGANASYTFTLPDSSNQTIDVTPKKQESQSLRLWNSAANTSINNVPIGGTTYFISAGPSSSLKAETLTNDSSLTQTAEGHWISRTKCTPEFSWEVGACTFNGTLMTDCVGNPGSNTTAIDTAALDVLKDYMTAIPWWIFREQLQIVDKTIDTLYAIPTAADWGHFFGNIAQSIAAISTAGYFGTASVPAVARVKEDVYIMRTVVLWIVLAMLSVVFFVSCLDIWRSKSRGLPFRAATFLAIANAVRGPWWDQELHGSCAADEVTMQKRSSASVMFGVDANNPYHLGLLPSVLPIQRDRSYFGVGRRKGPQRS